MLPPMKYVVWGLIVVLLVLHQDNWFWDSTKLVWDFMPVALLYHAGISLAAGVTWYLAVKFCWPPERGPSAAEHQQGGGPA